MPNRAFFRDPPTWLPVLLLAAGTCLLFGRIGGFGFILFDDPEYLTHNAIAHRGLTWEGASWAFTTTYTSNWHPLTWLSHMLDFQLFGMDPGAHHLVNLLFHVLNGVLLFLVLRRMTGATWKSWVVAALFLVHPLHVESVAWASERKDVLGTFFLMATIWAYLRYAARPKAGALVPVCLLFAMGLLSKATVVTLPFALLLLDYWPLGRIDPSSPLKNPGFPPRPLSGLIREKWPLFALTLLACLANLYSESSGNSVATVEILPPAVRVSNAVVSYASYLWKTAAPTSLAVFYPLKTEALTVGAVGGAALFLFAVTAGVLALMRRAPFLFTGWFWYLGTLVPMIGLVQVGEQAMADRYAYIPLIGIFVMIAWGMDALCSRWRYGRLALGIATALWLAVLSALTWRQVGYWRDPVTLDTRALEVSPGADKMRRNLGMAHNELGMALLEKGQPGEAAAHFAESLKWAPFEVTSLMNLGAAYAMEGKLDEAMARFEKVIEIQPDHAGAHGNLGRALLMKGRRDEAIAHLQAAVRSNPADAAMAQLLAEALRQPPSSGR